MDITRADSYPLGDDVIDKLDDRALDLFFVNPFVGVIVSFDDRLNDRPGSIVEEFTYTINGSVNLFDPLLDSVRRREAHADRPRGGEGKRLLAIEVVWVRSRDIESRFRNCERKDSELAGQPFRHGLARLRAHE